jgi:hypothetical protein
LLILVQRKTVGEMSSSGFVVVITKKITGSSANDLLSDATLKAW